jgi:histidine decarboxylase
VLIPAIAEPDLATDEPTTLDHLADVVEELEVFEREMASVSASMLGYPESQAFGYPAVLQRLLAYNLDNLGSPWSPEPLLYGVNSTRFERRVIDWFADLYQLPADQVWGCVTSSGSQGNLHGLYLAREAHPDGIVYYSGAAHYSIAKAARLLRIPTQVVPAQANGEYDYAALDAALAAHPDRPAIINVTLGTTVTGALDDLDHITAILTRHRIEQVYLHVDAALSGMILPFLDDAPVISFSRYPIDSVAVSGHKFLGAPFPCGILIARRHHAARIRADVAYIGALDETIDGSRNGQAPVYLWHALTTRGAGDGFRAEVATCRANAVYLQARLTAIGVPCSLNEHSITVVLPEPPERVVRTWSLARHHGHAHVITVPSATRTTLDAFVTDLHSALQQIDPPVTGRAQP